MEGCEATARLRRDATPRDEAAALGGEHLLLDLNGHTEGSRPALLAAGHAPVRALVLGYPG